MGDRQQDLIYIWNLLLIIWPLGLVHCHVGLVFGNGVDQRTKYLNIECDTSCYN